MGWAVVWALIAYSAVDAAMLGNAPLAVALWACSVVAIKFAAVANDRRL